MNQSGTKFTRAGLLFAVDVDGEELEEQFSKFAPHLAADEIFRV